MSPIRFDENESARADAQSAFEQYRDRLHRFLVFRLRNPRDADDISQDAYLRFLQISAQETIREPQALLYRLASNLVYEFHVRQRRSHVTFDSEVADGLAERSDDVWRDEVSERISSAQQIDAVLRRMPKSYQIVLLLRKRDGLSPEEIAQRLNLSKATVYTYLIRAVALFKHEFDNTGPKA